MTISAVVYDLEIKKAILGRGEKQLDGIEYCQGWGDHAGMGISVMGAYDYVEDRYRTFCDDNKEEFFKLLSERKYWVHFNGNAFDNKVIEACWMEESDRGSPEWQKPTMKTIWPFSSHEAPFDPNYDLLVEQWLAAGLGATFSPGKNAGYGLDATCQKNFGIGKTGNGALAPVLWQQGKYGELFDYCLTDVHRTKRLFDLVVANAGVISPKTGVIHMLREVAA